jgi:hypothetical protein
LWLVGVWPDSSGVYSTREAPTEVEVRAGETTTRELRVQRAGGALHGVIKDTAGATIGDFAGFVYAEETSGGAFAGTAITSGRFTLRLSPGTYRLVVDVPRTSPWTPTGPTKVTVLAGEEDREIVLTVRRNSATISGFITTAAGQPLANVAARVFASGPNGVWQETDVDQATGRYALAVSAGTWYLGAALKTSSSAYLPVRSERAVTVTEGATIKYDIPFATAAGTVSGSVLRPDGRPAPNVWVTVTSQRYGGATGASAIARGAETDAAGRFTLNVPAGAYFVYAYGDPSQGVINPEEQSVTITSGGQVEVTLRLRAPRTTVRGVVRRDGRGVTAFVSAWSESGGYAETTSADDGTYTLPASPEVWRLTAAAKHEGAFYRSTTVRLTVPAGDAVAAPDLVLEHDRPLPAAASAVVDASKPGLVAVNDGTSVALPARSIAGAASATVTVSPDTTIPQQGATQVVGVGYEVNAFADDGRPVTTFDDDLTITIPYDPAELARRGVNPRDLKVAYWDEATGSLRELPASVVNEAEGTVSATVAHLTRFYLVAAADVTPPSAPSAVTADATATSGGVTLRWTNPTRDFSHAKIYRSTAAGVLGGVLATDVTLATYADTNVAADTTYYYTVRAVDPAGNESDNTAQVAVGTEQPAAPSTSALATKLAGRILLQVESHGEAWYVSPVDRRRHYLGRPADAFQLMRTLGLGISNANLGRIDTAETGRTRATSAVAQAVSGRIVLQVEAKGEAWYVHPVTKLRHYLGRPADAFQLMRTLGLGISNADLATIAVATTSPTAP